MRSSVVDPDRSSKVGVRYPQPDFIPNLPQRPPSRPRFAPPAPKPSRRPITLAPAEGWSSLLFLAAALYSVVAAIMAANWVNHSALLLWSPALGLVVGFIIAKIPRFSQTLLHLAACLFGYWLAVWFTSILAFHISWVQLLAGLREVVTGGLVAGTNATSEIVFFFYLMFLCYFLGYFGCWLVYRARLPWLVALVYGSIMLVNLNYTQGDYPQLIIILSAALIPLIARVHLAAQVLEWKRDGLHTDRSWLRALTWRCMKVACAMTLLMLLVSWALPISSQPAPGKQLWDDIDNAWTNITNGRIPLQNPAAIIQPYQPAVNFFGDQLMITGKVHLPVGEVLYYTASSGGARYLEGFTYNQFDGHTWTSSLTPSDAQSFAANAAMPVDSGGGASTQITTAVTIVQPPDGPKHYIFGPAQPISFSVPTILYSDGTAAAWTQPTPLAKGEHYQVISMAPPADAQSLSRVPLPAVDAQAWRSDAYYNQLALYYEQIPHDISPNILQLTRQWTKGATSTYSALKMLESHLSDQKEFTYSVDNPPIPRDTDVIDWLFHTHQGYCTYYASAMAVMARQLGIPTRVVNGFSAGHFDSRRKVWSVEGSDAHSWVQAYFPGYGWISFDPTPGFSLPASAASHPRQPPVTTKPPAKPAPVVTPVTRKPALPRHQSAVHPPLPLPGSGSGGINEGTLLDLSLIALLISFLVFLVALIVHWWRSLYANSTLVAGTFWRLCRMAGWAGLAPRVWQTPYEYSRMLCQYCPQKAGYLWHLTELFVRDRWGAPHQAPHAREEKVVEQLWPALRGMLLRMALRRIKN